MMKLKNLHAGTKTTAILIIGTLFSFSMQSFSETKNNAEFQKWLNQNKSEFKQYLDEQDKAFADFLKQKWTNHEVKPEKKRDIQPKPTVIPKADPKDKVVETKPAPTPKPKSKPNEKPITSPNPKQEIAKPKPISPTPIQPIPAKPKLPRSERIAPVPIKGAEVRFSFLGHSISLPKLKTTDLKLQKLGGNQLADGWVTLAKEDFKPIVKGLNNIANKLDLDDWGRSLLTNRYTQKLNLSSNKQQMVNWFLLVKQGFDIRVAYDKQSLYLLMNVAQPLYGQTFFNKAGKRYYVVDLNRQRPIKVSRVWTYDKQHNSAAKAVYVNLQQPPVVAGNLKKRKLSTKVNGKTVSISVPYSQSYVSHLDYYPQMDMVHYFRAEPPQATKSGLLAQLKPKLNGLSETGKINFLLNFVQNSLKYQTDQEQFNYENYLFPTETLHYPYADCEDRSVLFAWLVKNLVGNNVVGLQYDGHIATAVELKETQAGDSFNVGGKRYTMADPTYYDATLGMTMPQYKNAQPSIIRF